jgi:hypothetical protein
MNTGNTGAILHEVPPGGQLRTPSGVYYCHAQACFFQLNPQRFPPWEVALTVVAAVVVVATVVMFVRRLRAG